MKQTVMLACLLLLVTVATAQKVIKNPELFSEKVDVLVQEYQDLDIFSGVVLVAEKGEILYHKAFGWANRDTKTGNTTSTKFDVGSMNKTFTGLIILHLLEEGKLSLDDRIGKYLTGISEKAAQKVTIDHLLNHTSGYGDYFGPEYVDLPTDQKTFRSILEKVKKEELIFEPGSAQEYSNSGYILLGAIIEEVSGLDYYDVVKSRILDPLKLSQTNLTNPDAIPNKAIGYYKDIFGTVYDNSEYVEYPKPDGGFFATALDVYKFYQEYHYGNSVVAQDTKMKDEFYRMIQPHRDTGGAIPFAGGYPGSNSVNFEILRDNITIVVLANRDEPVAERLGANILKIIRGQPTVSPSLPATRSVYQAYKENGTSYVKDHFNELTVNFHPTDPRDIILNTVGYQLLRKERVSEAIEMFLLNTALFADVANTWDSLGEAYLKAGELEKAKKSYQMALQLDPDLESARLQIRALSK